MYMPKRALAAFVSVAALTAGPALAADIELPSTIAWTAYDVGSTGYNQAVGIGSVIKNKNGSNLRVLPGKKDVSRLAPLREGKVQFSAPGPDIESGRVARRVRTTQYEVITAVADTIKTQKTKIN